MIKIKGISIRQPWADLVLRGVKTIELRDRIAIEEWPDYLVIHAPLTVEHIAASFYGYHKPWEMRRGVLLGIAKLETVITIDEKNFLETVERHLMPFPFDGERQGLVLRMIHQFETPIKFRGRLGLFDLTPELYESTLLQISNYTL